MDEVRCGGDSRLPLVGDICEVAATVQLGPSVRGTTRRGISCARGMTK
jgi:hypothetical protein